MYYYKEELINIIKPDKLDPAAARVLQEILGGQSTGTFSSPVLFLQSKKSSITHRVNG